MTRSKSFFFVSHEREQPEYHTAYGQAYRFQRITDEEFQGLLFILTDFFITCAMRFVIATFEPISQNAISLKFDGLKWIFYSTFFLVMLLKDQITKGCCSVVDVKTSVKWFLFLGIALFKTIFTYCLIQAIMDDNVLDVLQIYTYATVSISLCIFGFAMIDLYFGIVKKNKTN
jgi:hypothetical protein